VLASPPGNSATVLDVFACTGGTPAAISAGKLTNEPPPAKAFIAPASTPAAKTEIIGFMPAILAAGPPIDNLAIPALDFGNSES
jgi:hypothetical protein